MLFNTDSGSKVAFDPDCCCGAECSWCNGGPSTITATFSGVADYIGNPCSDWYSSGIELPYSGEQGGGLACYWGGYGLNAREGAIGYYVEEIPDGTEIYMYIQGDLLEPSVTVACLVYEAGINVARFSEKYSGVSSIDCSDIGAVTRVYAYPSYYCNWSNAELTLS